MIQFKLDYRVKKGDTIIISDIFEDCEELLHRRWNVINVEYEEGDEEFYDSEEYHAALNNILDK